MYLFAVCNAMKRKILTVLLIILTTFCYSQKVKKVIVKFHKSKQISRSYYVLRSNKNIKHGEYVSYFRLTNNNLKLIASGVTNIDDYIKQNGNYQNGKKEGKWIENMSSFKRLIGVYHDGKKIGVWDTYFYEEKRSSYDHDNNKRVGIWYTKKENGEVIERFDYDQNVYLQPIIRILLSYPEIAKENGVQGTVKVRFHINTECTIENLTIIQNLSPECDNAALVGIKRYGELLKKYSKTCEDKTEEMSLSFKLF